MPNTFCLAEVFTHEVIVETWKDRHDLWWLLSLIGTPLSLKHWKYLADRYPHMIYDRCDTREVLLIWTTFVLHRRDQMHLLRHLSTMKVSHRKVYLYRWSMRHKIFGKITHWRYNSCQSVSPVYGSRWDLKNSPRPYREGENSCRWETLSRWDDEWCLADRCLQMNSNRCDISRVLPIGNTDAYRQNALVVNKISARSFRPSSSRKIMTN